MKTGNLFFESRKNHRHGLQEANEILMADEKLKDSAVIFTELDDGKIETGTPKQTPIFDGKNPWVSGEDVPLKTNPLSIV